MIKKAREKFSFVKFKLAESLLSGFSSQAGE